MSNNRLVGLKTPAFAPGSAADSAAAAGVRAASLKDKLKMAGKAIKTIKMLQPTLGGAQGDGTPSVSEEEAAKTAMAVAKARAVFGLMEKLEHCELDDNAIRASFVDLFGGRAPMTLQTFSCKKNHFKGPLDSRTFNGCMNLGRLNLNQNRLTGPVKTQPVTKIDKVLYNVLLHSSASDFPYSNLV